MRIKQQAGFTLLEGLLATVIAAFFITLGLRLYQSMAFDTETQQLKANVDQLFQAASGYYYANCNVGQTLDTAMTPANPTVVMGAGISTLATQGFVSKWPLLSSPIINQTIGNKGYIVQFYLLPSTQHSIYVCSPTSPCTPSPYQVIPSAQAVASVWIIVVSVTLNDPSTISMYQSLLGADCTSTTLGSGVKPCSSNSPGNYLVWQKLPSVAAQSNDAGYGLPLFLLKEFNLQYTHDSMYEFNNGYTSPATPKYYRCGG